MSNWLQRSGLWFRRGKFSRIFSGEISLHKSTFFSDGKKPPRWIIAVVIYCHDLSEWARTDPLQIGKISVFFFHKLSIESILRYSPSDWHSVGRSGGKIRGMAGRKKSEFWLIVQVQTGSKFIGELINKTAFAVLSEWLYITVRAMISAWKIQWNFQRRNQLW